MNQAQLFEFLIGRGFKQEIGSSGTINYFEKHGSYVRYLVRGNKIEKQGKQSTFSKWAKLWKVDISALSVGENGKLVIPE